MSTESISAEQFIGWLRGLVRHKHGESRAPHKPLTLLYFLARCSRGESRLMSFANAEAPLAELLERFGRPGIPARPWYPWYRLAKDANGQLWELAPREELKRLENASGDPPLAALRQSVGGFCEAVQQLLVADSATLHLGATVLLEEFPETLREDILDAVDMYWQVISLPARRSAEFRKQVLRAYERACAVCSFSGRLGTREFAIDAAHIKWHAYGGPDDVTNGVAMCVFHHKAFDQGAFTFDAQLRLEVSSDLNGHGIEPLLIAFQGRELVLPRDSQLRPRADHVQWHREQVFVAAA